MVEIVSKQTIKPSKPTPHNLRDFKLSFLDQLSPCYYVPVLLFYSASDATSFSTSFSSLSHKLKASLSEVLSFYYPFGGRIKGTTCVECNDEGVLYFEARVPFRLLEILEDPQPQVNVLKQFLPFDPYKTRDDHHRELENMVVQVSEFSCGAVGLGVCILHKIADGTTLASFLNAWVAIAKGNGNTTKPYMEAALLFPPGDIDFSMSSADDKDLVTRRLTFDGNNISRLRDDIKGCNPTRVEAVTAFIWKSALEAARAVSSREHTLRASIVSHVVDIRNLMVPPLPKNSIGNLYQLTTSPLVELEMDKRVELQDLAVVGREAIRKVDADYVSKLVGDGGFDLVHMAMESVGQLLYELPDISGGAQGYTFSSWITFPFYEIDFGWGKPTWVCTISPPGRNLVFLMPTRCGKGIEAWVNLTKQDMLEFECNPELLQYASLA